MAGIAAEVGAVARRGPVKTQIRVQAKCEAMKREDGRPLQVVDVLRSQVVCATPAQVKAARRRVLECALFQPAAGRARTKNRFRLSSVVVGGYRDLLVNVLFDGQQMGEVQICWRPFSVIRLKSHAYYDLQRTMTEWMDENPGATAVSPVRTRDALNLMDGVALASEGPLGFWAFLSGGALNFFIPSGGGQWVVQGPIFLEAAERLGTPRTRA